MFKLNPSEKWYKKTAEEEDNVIDQSIGGIIFNYDQLSMFSAREKEETLLLKHSFSLLVKKLRITKGMTIPELARKLDVDSSEILLIESNVDHRPTLRTIRQISIFFDLPYQVLAKIVGAVKTIDKELKSNLIRYAANSDKFEKLTKEEKRLLNEIIKLIKNRTNK